MKKSSTTLLMNARLLHYTYDGGSLLFKSIFVYFVNGFHTSVILIILDILIVTCIFYH